MSKDKEVLVKFLKHYTPYAKGDVTTIDGEKFEALKKAGVVEENKGKKAANTDEVEMIDHVVTKKDLKMNPELAEKGLQVGDTIQMPKNEE